MLRSGFYKPNWLGIHNRWPTVSSFYASMETFGGKGLCIEARLGVSVIAAPDYLSFALCFLPNIQFETELLVYYSLLFVKDIIGLLSHLLLSLLFVDLSLPNF